MTTTDDTHYLWNPSEKHEWFRLLPDAAKDYMKFLTDPGRLAADLNQLLPNPKTKTNLNDSQRDILIALKLMLNETEHLQAELKPLHQVFQNHKTQLVTTDAHNQTHFIKKMESISQRTFQNPPLRRLSSLKNSSRPFTGKTPAIATCITVFGTSPEFGTFSLNDIHHSVHNSDAMHRLIFMWHAAKPKTTDFLKPFISGTLLYALYGIHTGKKHKIGIPSQNPDETRVLVSDALDMAKGFSEEYRSQENPYAFVQNQRMIGLHFLAIAAAKQFGISLAAPDDKTKGMKLSNIQKIYSSNRQACPYDLNLFVNLSQAVRWEKNYISHQHNLQLKEILYQALNDNSDEWAEIVLDGFTSSKAFTGQTIFDAYSKMEFLAKIKKMVTENPFDNLTQEERGFLQIEIASMEHSLVLMHLIIKTAFPEKNSPFVEPAATNPFVLTYTAISKLTLFSANNEIFDSHIEPIKSVVSDYAKKTQAALSDNDLSMPKALGEKQEAGLSVRIHENMRAQIGGDIKNLTIFKILSKHFSANSPHLAAQFLEQWEETFQNSGQAICHHLRQALLATQYVRHTAGTPGASHIKSTPKFRL